jgi:hypothetical protein
MTASGYVEEHALAGEGKRGGAGEVKLRAYAARESPPRRDAIV